MAIAGVRLKAGARGGAMNQSCALELNTRAAGLRVHATRMSSRMRAQQLMRECACVRCVARLGDGSVSVLVHALHHLQEHLLVDHRLDILSHWSLIGPSERVGTAHGDSSGRTAGCK